MLHLTKCYYKVKSSVEQKIERINTSFQKEVEKAESFGFDPPVAPTYEMKKEDYDRKDTKLSVKGTDIISVHQDYYGDTEIEMSTGTVHSVVESFDEVVKMWEKDGKQR